MTVESSVALPSGTLPLLLKRNPRARRYILRLRPDGTAAVTVPRGGNAAEAEAFARRHGDWLERQKQRVAARPRQPATWEPGHVILFRGEAVRLEAVPEDHVLWIHFGDQALRVCGSGTDLRPAVQRHLWRLAARELPPRLLAHASAHGLTVRRVTVRNQRTRWGSCSRHGAISLNWRLIQTPVFVQDYLCLHELMHLRQMNHSPRFWHEVEAVCPDYRLAERWLKAHTGLLR